MPKEKAELTEALALSILREASGLARLVEANSGNYDIRQAYHLLAGIRKNLETAMGKKLPDYIW